MPDIDTIRGEIDGLHAKATPTACSPKAVDALILSIAAHWPTISAALAEAETLRRKERAFDAIANRSVGIEPNSNADDLTEWVAWSFCPLPPSKIAEGHDLLTAIEAALAAKEGQ